MGESSGYVYYGPKAHGMEYYIHYEKTHIGQAAPGNSSLSAFVQKIKGYQKLAIEDFKRNFKKQVYNNIDISKSSQVILNEIFSNEDIFLDFQRQLAKEFETTLKDRIEKAISLEQNVDRTGYFLINGDTQEKIKSFNNFLESASQAVQLINMDSKEDLAKAILAGKTNSGKNLTKNLEKALNLFKIQNMNKMLDFDYQSCESIVKRLEDICKHIKNQDFSKKEQFDALIKNGLFSTEIAESIAATCTNTAHLSLDNAMKSLTGTQKYAPQYTPSVEMSKQSEKYGKTDVLYSNIKFTYENKSTKDIGEITLSVGGSNKTYKSSGFMNNKGTNTNLMFSSGSAGSLKSFLYDNLMEDIDRYYAFNIITHEDIDPEAISVIQEFLLIKNFNRLFIGRGQGDFSQLIFLNGQVFSLYELFLEMINTKGSFGFSTSTGQSDSPITVHIQGRRNIYTANSWSKKGRWDRSHKVNIAIEKAKLMADIHMNNLKNLRLSS